MARHVLKEVELMFCEGLCCGELEDLAEGWIRGLDNTYRARVAAEYLTVSWNQLD